MDILKKDRVSKTYFEDKNRFADLLNGIIFQGEAVLQADNIHEKKREVTFPKNKTKYIEVTRDIVNSVDVQATVILVAIEEQSDVHYAMPVRVMSGDCGSYYEQWKNIARFHKEQNDLRDAEYISGFSKDDKLVPSISIVVYLGEKPWDGPRTLRDMFNMEKLPEELQKYVTDYPMFLLEVRKYEKLEDFQTDIRIVFGYFQNASNKNKLKKFLADNQYAFEHMPEDAFDFMSTVSHSKELEELKIKYMNPKGEINMCKAIQEMILDGKQEGIQEGIKDGYVLAGMYMKKKAEGKTDEQIAEECGRPIEDIQMFFTVIA